MVNQDKRKNLSRLQLLFIAALSLGIFLRLLAATRGHNFDVESYWLVGDIFNEGGNVYAETRRYNYGPVWFFIVSYFHKISVLFDDPFTFFRYAITFLLTLVDIGIAFWLKRQFGYKAAILFFLNPISIIITGFHSQFDNLAVYLGMLSISTYQAAKTNKKGFLSALILLGLSIMTKHLLFIFPFWLFIREKGLGRKIAALTVPVAIFLAGFVPFWAVGYEGIKQHVFLYRSFNNAPLLNYSLPPFAVFLTGQVLFIAALVAGAFIFRKLEIKKAFLFYTALLVVFSSAVTNQYLAIIMPFISVYANPVFLLYTLVAGLYLAGDKVGLNIFRIKSLLPDELITEVSKGKVYYIPIAIAFVGLIYAVLEEKGIKPLKQLFKYIRTEAKAQLKLISGKD